MPRDGASASVAELDRGSLELVESKLQRPDRPSAVVPRRRLLEQLRGTEDIPVVLLSAPPGYGKTTLLSQWTSEPQRTSAWLTLDRGDNDPVAMLGYLASALDRIEPIDPEVFEALDTQDISVEGTLVPRLAAAMAGLDDPFVLVLDDLQAVTNPPCLDALTTLISHVPEGSRLALAVQGQPALKLGSMRAGGLVFELGAEDLRMDVGEAAELLRAGDRDVPDDAVEALTERTEGWPAGLYLASLALPVSGDTAAMITSLRGDDRFLVDYLREELLDRLPAETVGFMTRTSVLEQMSGPLCDAILGADDSAARLQALEEGNLFVAALDRHRDRYRYHQLFRELLRAQLERAEPELVPDLLARASDWCAENGEPEAAFAYAREAGDTDRAAVLFVGAGQALYQRGRAATISQWLDWLAASGRLHDDPRAAVFAAWFCALRGRPGEMERWADAADRRLRELDVADEDVLLRPWQAVIRAGLCRNGPERMREDAQIAAQGFGRASPWWPTAAILLATAHHLAGEDALADDLFADVIEGGSAVDAWNAVSVSFAERALLAIDRDDWGAAEDLVEQAEAVVRRSRMQEYGPNMLVYAAAARVAIHRGEHERAGELLAHAQRLRPRLTRALAALAAQSGIEIAHAYAAGADVAGARTLLRETDGLMRRGQGLGVLAARADELRARLNRATVKTPGASTLTKAELRLLPMLPTHLSFREIGERLYLSRHTVKSQAMSIYRKLDVTSRNAAVERARDLGLL